MRILLLATSLVVLVLGSGLAAGAPEEVPFQRDPSALALDSPRDYAVPDSLRLSDSVWTASLSRNQTVLSPDSVPSGAEYPGEQAAKYPASVEGVTTLVWKASDVMVDCAGPQDGEGRYWYDYDFDDSGWSQISLPDYVTGTSASDRYYRASFDLGCPPESAMVNLSFASDDGIWVYVNGSLLGHWGGACHAGGCVNDPVGTCGGSEVVPCQTIPSMCLPAM
jgi:hypothetical protein